MPGYPKKNSSLLVPQVRNEALQPCNAGTMRVVSTVVSVRCRGLADFDLLQSRSTSVMITVANTLTGSDNEVWGSCVCTRVRAFAVAIGYFSAEMSSSLQRAILFWMCAARF